MDIQKEREAFEAWWEDFHNGRQIACDYVEEDNSYAVGYANAQWVAWQAAKAQIVSVAEWNNYETKSPRIDGRYLIFVGGEQLCADFSVGFGFSSAEDGTAFIQELITHWAVPCDDPIGAQEQVG